MAITDNIIFETGNPKTEQYTGISFQTSDLFACCSDLRISADGQLILHQYRREPTGRVRELRGMDWPIMRKTQSNDEILPLHGDLRISGNDKKGRFVDLVVRFTHGELEEVRQFDELSAAEQLLSIGNR